MAHTIEFSTQEDHLLVTLSDTLITVERAHEVLTRIGEACADMQCKLVLLDERTVERREVPPHEIMNLSTEMEKQGLTRIHIAFWCRPELVDEDADKLSLFTYTNQYVVQHFSDKEKAIAWLRSRNRRL